MAEPLKGQLRSLKCHLAYLEKADGSCSLSQGHTTAWASCSGPGDVHISRRENERMHLDVSFRVPSGDNSHNKVNSILKSALQAVVNTSHFPRTCLTVTVNCLEDFGSLYAVGITAAALAILDNGIPCRGIFCGINVVRVDGKLILDPDNKTERKSDASFLFILQENYTDGIQLVGANCVGAFDVDEFNSALSLATEGSKQIFNFFKEMIHKKLTVEPEVL